MKDYIEKLEKKVMDGECLSREEALSIFGVLDIRDSKGFNQLMESAGRIRKHHMGKKFELCSIINARSGKCTQDCKYCAQSIHYATGCAEYGLMEYEQILKMARQVQEKGVRRFSIVTSGKGIQSEEELERLCSIYRRLSKDTGLLLCASHGIIDKGQAMRLRNAGVCRYHHNIETSRTYYPAICTTHTYEDRIRTIRDVQEAGLEVCCGGILGLGENRIDRVDMAVEIRRLAIDSVPLNILMPVEGTPLERIKQPEIDEILVSMAVFRFVLPKAHIRYAGGRMKLGKRQKEGIETSVSAAITGDYLTTTGSGIEMDRRAIEGLGFELE